jgi:hypothetical protein
MPAEQDDRYGLPAESSRKRVPAPELSYRPQDPASYRPKIGLIGCGGISVQHLRAYQAAGYQVAALCARTQRKAREQAERFFPEAEVVTDYRQVLAREDIEVVDIATHPEVRAGMLTEAIEAGKHVLSQKPFVTDLDGERLADGRRPAVAGGNQNGRWPRTYAVGPSRGLAGCSACASPNWDSRSAGACSSDPAPGAYDLSTVCIFVWRATKGRGRALPRGAPRGRP